MRQPLLCLSLLLVACAFVGCGSGSGIESGIPSDTNTAPVNPTPDMGAPTKDSPKM